VKSALRFSSAHELYENVKDLIIETECPRCGAKIKARRGKPFYCYKCGVVFDEWYGEKRVLIDVTREEGW